MNMEHCWNNTDGENNHLEEKTCPTSPVFTTNPTSSATVATSDFRGQGTASDLLSLRTARKGNFAYLFLSH